MHDVQCFSYYDDWNFEGNESIAFGYNTGYRVMLLNWNISDMIEAVDAGFAPEQVHIRLYGINNVHTTDPMTVKVYEINETWNNATVTYATLPEMGNLVTTYYMNGTNPPIYQYFFVDVTDSFMSYLEAGNASNFFGYYFYSPVSGNQQFFQLKASEVGETDEPAIWYNDLPLGYEEEEEEDSLFSTTEGTNWMLLFILLFVPTFVLIGGLKDYVPVHISFISGFTIMVAITRVTLPSLMPLWLLFVFVIIIVLMLFSMLKREVF